MQAISRSPIGKPPSLRVYLVLLHVMFLVLYGLHFHLLPANRLEGGLIIALATITLLVLTLPKSQLSTAWFLGFLTLGNAGVLFAGSMLRGLSTGSWMVCVLLLLLAMASYATSVLHFSILSSLIIGGYGAMLHRAALLHHDQLVVLPALLCLTLVFLSKISIAQAEMQRISDTEEHTRTESLCDALTGLPNRAQFLERVARSVKCGQQNRDFHFAILFVDLDGFKPINDRLGHKAGDAVLQYTSKLFQGCLRKGDLVARYGGDEFTFVINNVKGPTDAIHVAERILAKIQAPINVGEPVKVGASIGIALSTNMHERAEDLIRDADGAMYRAKGKGKNCYVISEQASDIPKSELKERWKRMAQLSW
jgi:diguanylate cyclase (GGDEF)-like protein